MKRDTGSYRTSTTAGETVRAFVPHPLPPDPDLVLSPDDLDRLERANRALGRLDGLTSVLPDPSLFLYFYVRKEAVVSSQIEGTQSSLSDLLMHETDQEPGVPLDDVSEVSHYIAAIDHGLRRLRGGFPLSVRLLREVHGILLRSGRGAQKSPGEFRLSQNWIGGTRPGNATYVPPPPAEIPGLMSDLERFVHDRPVRTPALIKAALLHAQFETIHPFLDGNGRIGRLLITLLLCAAEILSEPILYLSLYFKQHRSTYYDLLQAIRTDGDWEAWLGFFLDGVIETSGNAVAVARGSLELFADHRRQLGQLGRSAASVLRVQEHLQRHPITTIPKTAEALGLSQPTVGTGLARMEELGFVQEVTGNKTWRVFSYKPFLVLLGEGTEPLDAPSRR